MKISYTIKKNSTIKEALKKLSECGEKCLLVIDNNNKLLGTISDGDIRKSIVNDKSLSNNINKIYNNKPKKFYENKIDKKLIEKYFLNLRLDVIPIVNKKNILVDAILFSKYFSKKNISKFKKINSKIDVVIMAGGLGSRLAPYSKIIPKPLLPFKNSTLIEYIISNFTKHSLKNFILSVNYKENLIKSYFKTIKEKYKIKYINEEFPMGTVGALSKIDKVSKVFFLINCDSIIDIDYYDLYNFHISNKNDITIVSSTKEFTIPYGCFKINQKGEMIEIIEKPSNNYLVNTGLYVLNSKLISKIPKNSSMDFNIFLNKIKTLKYKIGFYTISEKSWQDYGELSSFGDI